SERRCGTGAEELAPRPRADEPQATQIAEEPQWPAQHVAVEEILPHQARGPAVRSAMRDPVDRAREGQRPERRPLPRQYVGDPHVASERCPDPRGRGVFEPRGQTVEVGPDDEAGAAKVSEAVV